MKKEREADRKLSRLMEKFKVDPSTETPEEAESIAKGGSKAKEGKDTKESSR